MDPFAFGRTPRDEQAPPAAVLGRRQWLVAAGSVALVGGTLASRSSLADDPARLPPIHAAHSLEFFTAGEAAFIDAAVDRLIPADALGPGAVEAGVAVFIDRQLAAPTASADCVYMQGPFAPTAPTAGLPAQRTPAEVYRKPPRRASTPIRATHVRQGLRSPARSEQIDAAHGLEQREPNSATSPGKTFFDLSGRTPMEGFFADPLYLGNRDLAGWKLIGFPGTRYDYRDVLANTARATRCRRSA